MENITQIYWANNETTPFIVRRHNWDENYGLLIIDVAGNYKYGKVNGFGLPPLNGRDAKPYWGLPGEPKEIPNSGSFQWKIVNDIPWEWQQWINEYKNGSHSN